MGGEQDLALNNLQVLLSDKTQPTNHFILIHNIYHM